VINDDDGSGDGHGGMIALHRTITDYKGATENAGLENSGPSKMQRWKTRD